MPLPSVVAEDDPDSGATRVSVFTPDREGLFYRICAGLAAAGANIIDARIHTTRDGMALDNLLVHRRARDAPMRTAGCATGWSRSVEKALDVASTAAARRRAPMPVREQRISGRAVASLIAERASTRTTVVEVNARDRPALLAAAGARRSTTAGTSSIPRTSRPMASARSTSST